VWQYADGTGTPSRSVWWPHFASRVIELETSSYTMSPVAVMLRHDMAGISQQEYRVTNRLLGEATVSSPGELSLNSSILHQFYHQQSFGLGTIFFNPAANASFGAPPQEAMVGLTFNNAFHSTVGVPHSSGSKWAAQVDGAAVLAKCGGSLGCHYDGDFSTEIYNVSTIHKRWSSDASQPWIIVQPDSDSGAFAAVKYAWGGLNMTASSIQHGVTGSGNHSFRIVPNDPTSPLLMFAGNRSMFGSLDGFTRAVLSANFSVASHGESKLILWDPPGLPTIAFPWSANKTTLQMPTIGGKPIDAAPARTYDGPFLVSTLGEQTVRATSGPDGLSLVYDFSSDTITEV